MSDDAKLLVPMYMEALTLWQDNSDCIDLRPRFQNYNTSFLGDVLQPTGLDKTTLEKGVHLHWVLPKALKHSFLDEGSETEFPFAPNRWMVTRIQTNGGMTNMPSRIWIVESDFIYETEVPNSGAPAQTPIMVLVDNNNALTFKNVGRQVALTDFNDTFSACFLTATAAANPNFSSFYPGCRNIFGFHDSLDDITGECTLAYVVTGWYNDPASDPLAPLDFTGDQLTDEQKKKKRSLDWFREQWNYKGENYPGSCLLYSTVHSISWSQQDAAPAVPEGPIAVYAGNTSIEALSAMIRTDKTASKPDMEELLNALQYQLLEDDHNQPTLSSIKDEIHKRGFSTTTGGTIWQINRVQNQDKQTQDSSKAAGNFPQDPQILTDLKALNNLQGQVNSLTWQTLSWQQEYYMLWNKQAQKIIWTAKNSTIGGFGTDDYNNAREKIKDIIQNNLGAAGQITALQAQIDALKQKLNNDWTLNGTPPEFELIEKPDDRFSAPNEPVLLLRGAGIGNTIKISGPASGKNIECRTVEQVMNGLELSIQSQPTNISVKVPVSSFTIPGVDALSASIIPAAEEIKALTYESLLFNDALSLNISLTAYNIAQLGGGKDSTSPEIIAFASTLPASYQQILNKEVAADTESAAILPPAPYSINKWVQAWSPMFMVWGAKFYPLNTNLLNLDILADTGNWALDDNLFFKNQSANINGGENLVPFYNISPFSSAVLSNFKRLLPSEITDQYGDQNVIAQSLSGLHKVLLMQNPVIQLPPLVYDIPSKFHNYHTDYLIDQTELNDIGADGYRLGSIPGDTKGEIPGPFFPFRSGLLQIVSLSIIDAFGQEQKVITDSFSPNIITADNLSGVAASAPNLIPMPPRFLQPSRLKFQWLNSNNEAIYQDAGSLDNPVFGWLVPNFLDNSLMVYDGFGIEVIILQITDDLTKAKGIGLQTLPFPGLTIPYDLSANPDLAKFIGSFNTAPIVAGLIDLAFNVNLNITGNNPVQNNNAALLCGQPIALANCNVWIEQLGMPAFNQSWGQTGKNDTGGIETVQVPLFFGDYDKSKDGLIGYFPSADTTPALYTTMNAPDFTYSKTEPFFKSNSPLKLNINQGAIKLTLLLDPSAGIHISSAVLPTAFIELFPQNSKNLVDSLDISFMAAPFIAEKVAPGIPVPSSINADWKWVHKSDVATWQKDEDVNPGKNKQTSSFVKQMIYEGWLKLSNLRTTK